MGSTPNCTFKKCKRLQNASDFRQVFEDNQVKIANSSLLILARLTNRRSSRLGLVVAKKNIPTAVQRNLLKRVVRETFRQHQFEIPVDIVFLARSGADKLVTSQLTALLQRSWITLGERCHK